MTLSCDYYYEPEPGDVLWSASANFSACDRKRQTKCCSCGASVKPGDSSLKFHRWKVPESDIECRIYGEDYDDGPLRAPAFMCFDCGAFYQALERHGYALNIYDNMRLLMSEHDDLALTGMEGCR